MEYDVTIGIPVYRSKDYIRLTLESALAQSYQSIEFLIVDDCGHDGSMQIIEEFQQTHVRGKNIRIIRHNENQGVSASRNQIIDEAQGIFLYFMDSDDVIVPNTVNLLMQAVKRYDAEIAFGSYEKIEMSGKRSVYQYPSLQLLGEDKLAEFAYRKYAGIQASACNYLVKTSLLRENNLRFIDTDYWEDLVFTFNLVTYIKRAVLLPDITYSYLCRDDSLSRYQVRAQISKDEILKNIQTIDYLKKTSSLLYNKVYFAQRCYNIVMTDFYIACKILKSRKEIHPSITNNEIKGIMSHPASWYQICHFKQFRYINLAFSILGTMPSSLCVFVIWCLSKLR